MSGHPTGHGARVHAALAVLVLVVAGAAGCSESEGDDEPALSATWTIPDDVCQWLDLVGIVTETVATPQQPPRAGTEDVEADRAGCAAGAGSGFQVTVELLVSEDTEEQETRVSDAQARLDPPSTWSSIGAVEDVPVADDVASWAGSTETAAYSVTALAATDDVEDAFYLHEVVVAVDDNLVAVVTVSSTSPGPQASAPDEAATALAAAAAAVPEALGG